MWLWVTGTNEWLRCGCLFACLLDGLMDVCDSGLVVKKKRAIERKETSRVNSKINRTIVMDI